MKVNHFVTLYLTAPTATVIEAVQGDGVRVIAARLMDVLCVRHVPYRLVHADGKGFQIGMGQHTAVLFHLCNDTVGDLSLIKGISAAGGAQFTRLEEYED